MKQNKVANSEKCVKNYMAHTQGDVWGSK